MNSPGCVAGCCLSRRRWVAAGRRRAGGGRGAQAVGGGGSLNVTSGRRAGAQLVAEWTQLRTTLGVGGVNCGTREGGECWRHRWGEDLNEPAILQANNLRWWGRSSCRDAGRWHWMGLDSGQRVDEGVSCTVFRG